jgi:hypothetical protein
MVVANLREHPAGLDGPITADERTAALVLHQELERGRVRRPAC